MTASPAAELIVTGKVSTIRTNLSYPTPGVRVQAAA
jgi:hypothetical protein